jgi:hypothetical protein
MEIDMLSILLSMPEFYLYLAFLMTLLTTALWTGESDPPADEPRVRALKARGIADIRGAVRGSRDPAPLPSSALLPERERRPFRDLQATLLASCAVRSEQAQRTIRGFIIF